MKKIGLRRITAFLMSVIIMIPLITFNMDEYKVSAASNEQTIYNFLTGTMGVNSAAACGVVASIKFESGFNPGASESGGSGYGLCQWTGSRKTNLINWCNKNGYTYSTIEGQLKFLEYELKNSYKSVYNTMKNVENSYQGAYDVAYAFCMNFEKPEYRNKTHGQYDANGKSKTNGGYDVYNAYDGKVVKCTDARIGLTESEYRGYYASGKYWYKYNPSYYADIKVSTYYLKNNYTGTYINSSSASNGGAVSLAAKSTTNAFKMKISGSKSAGYCVAPAISSNYVLNPYSDSPGHGTKITMYEKTTDGTQNFMFEKYGNGYIIHIAANKGYVLTASGTGVVLKLRTCAANQIWTLEDINAVTLSSISVSTPPSTVIYENGTTFNTSGMVVTAKYSNGTTKNVTGYKTTYDLSKAGNVNVTVSYTENGVTKTAIQSVTVQDLFKGGGTDADPYQISTADDLNNLAKQINNINAVGCYGTASYIQTADIKVGIMTEPIGSCYENSTSETISLLAVFKGHYNGNYHKLYDVKLDYSRSYAGIFGKIGGAGLVENIAAYGEIKGVNFVGGIAGEEGYGSTIKNCSFNGTVTADGIAGGIVGRNQNGGIISGCYANADITVNNSYVGGLTGYVTVGGNESSSNSVIENSYFVGNLKGEINGGIAGDIKLETVKECTITFTNCYHLDSVSAGAVNSKEQTGCKALSSDTIKTTGTILLGTPFTTARKLQNSGYPVFDWQKVLLGDVNANNEFSDDDIVMLKSYLVKTDKLVDFSAADFDNNGLINVFDFILAKRTLIF